MLSSQDRPEPEWNAVNTSTLSLSLVAFYVVSDPVRHSLCSVPATQKKKRLVLLQMRLYLEGDGTQKGDTLLLAFSYYNWPVNSICNAAWRCQKALRPLCFVDTRLEDASCKRHVPVMFPPGATFQNRDWRDLPGNFGEFLLECCTKLLHMFKNGQICAYCCVEGIEVLAVAVLLQNQQCTE